MEEKTVKVQVEGIGTFLVPTEMNLRQGLRREGIYLDGTCADQGRCGRCVIRVIQGDPGQAGDLEQRLLGHELLAQGNRLACTVYPSADLTIVIDPDSILELDRTGRWKETWGSALWQPERFLSSYDGLGVAVDLGTTSIASVLFDLERSRPLDILASANPQEPWGEEVLSRLAAARGDRDTAKQLQNVLFDTVSNHLRRLCSRNGVSTRNIKRVVLVGNSAIHHLGLGLEVSSLLTAPFTTSELGERTLSPHELPLKADLGSEARFVFPPLLGGFVGSDLTAALLAARAAGKSSGIIMDTGTNSEIAVWGQKRILVSSAAAGPAFEGGHIRCGMKAEEGAIYRVALTDDGIEYEVIGGGEPAGICGTGILDIVSEMVKRGLVDATGRVMKDVHPCQKGDVLVVDENSGVVFVPRDVETVQKAKAALAAVLDLLLKRMNVQAAGIGAFYLAGAFGGRLNTASARAIGLLPPLQKNSYVLAGNASLVGASFILVSREAQQESRRLARSVEHLSVADDPAFEELYLENLFF